MKSGHDVLAFCLLSGERTSFYFDIMKMYYMGCTGAANLENQPPTDLVRICYAKFLHFTLGTEHGTPSPLHGVLQYLHPV